MLAQGSGSLLKALLKESDGGGRKHTIPFLAFINVLMLCLKLGKIGFSLI